jgi:hypothetical protein
MKNIKKMIVKLTGLNKLGVRRYVVKTSTLTLVKE